MKLKPHVMNLDWTEAEKRLERFIKDYVEKANAKGIVLGISGGIDSCTAASLCARAIGGNKVLGLMLPERETRSAKDMRHAKLVADKFGFKTENIDITHALEALCGSIPVFDAKDKVSKGNVKARTRMIYIYYYANASNVLVCGSSDKSETMMGYFTKWGDVAADIYPIMDLYKSQVRRLAQHLGIPTEIITKPPSPALWPNQLAEDELGMKYEQLDLVLYGLEHFMEPEEIASQLEIDKRLVERIKFRWLSAEHKRRMLLTAKLGYRTIGVDFRLQRNPQLI